MQDNINLEPFLTLEVRNALLQHMLAEGDKECCGVITFSKDKYAYVPKENINPDPVQHFSFDKATMADISRKRSIVAYCHSHPAGPQSPTARDTQVQASVKKASVIAARDPDHGTIEVFSFGDHLLDYPLDGREFRYNVFDCCSALRSYAHQVEGRYMPPPPPNDDNWWMVGMDGGEEFLENLNLYEKNFARYGYKEFTPDLDNPSSPWSLQPHDVLMMQLGAPVINHVAVYVGDNMIYHHRIGKKSGKTPIGYVLQQGYVRKYVRHGSYL